MQQFLFLHSRRQLHYICGGAVRAADLLASRTASARLRVWLLWDKEELS